MLVPRRVIWVFPKIRVPPNHPFVHRVWNHYKPSILGYPYFWKHPYKKDGNGHFIPLVSLPGRCLVNQEGMVQGG